MTHKFSGDIIAIFHFFWILFSLVSLPLLFLIAWWDWVTLVFVSINVFSWPIFRGCWFSQAENKHRKQYNPKEAFEGKLFIQHYLKKLFNIHFSRWLVNSAIFAYMALLAAVAIIKIL